MALFPDKIINLVEEVKKLPGIGEKSALKMALYFCNLKNNEILNFNELLKQLIDLKNCNNCGAYSDEEQCSLCTSSKRESSILCIVEHYLDYIAIEKGGGFNGRYHILGGVLNPLLGIGPSEINLHNLNKRIESENVEEVILALNPSVEGDATCSYIKEILPDRLEINRIGFGIPLGSNLEYIDSLTIMKAMENKKKL